MNFVPLTLRTQMMDRNIEQFDVVLNHSNNN